MFMAFPRMGSSHSCVTQSAITNPSSISLPFGKLMRQHVKYQTGQAVSQSSLLPVESRLSSNVYLLTTDVGSVLLKAQSSKQRRPKRYVDSSGERGALSVSRAFVALSAFKELQNELRTRV